jgi:hypothetical protein
LKERKKGWKKRKERKSRKKVKEGRGGGRKEGREGGRGGGRKGSRGKWEYPYTYVYICLYLYLHNIDPHRTICAMTKGGEEEGGRERVKIREEEAMGENRKRAKEGQRSEKEARILWYPSFLWFPLKPPPFH